MPSWLLGTIIVGGSMLLSITGAILVRRLVPHTMRLTNNEIGGIIFGLIGTIYSILVAFVVVVVWEQFDVAEDHVEAEANQIGDLYLDAAALPDSFRLPLQRELLEYTRAIVEEEWVLMAIPDTMSPRARQSYESLWMIVRTIPGDTPSESAWLSTILDRLNDLGDSRRLRLLSSESSVHELMWVLMFAGGVITIIFACFFGIESMTSHLTMVAALSGMIAFVLFLIAALDHPFDGPVRVQPKAFHHVMRSIQ